MKTTILPLAALAVLGLGVGAASAASPSHCALFAKRFVEYAAKDGQTPPSQLAHDRAYHRCLNMDNEPPLPTAYTDPATDGNGRPEVVEEGSGVPSAATADEKTAPAVANPLPQSSAPQSSVPAAPQIEEAAARQPEPKPDAAVKPKKGLKSFMTGLMGKFRRDPTPSPSPSPSPSSSSPSPTTSREASVIGDWGSSMSASERAAWCAEHFPKSYDARTGTVIPYETGVRTKC